MVRCGVWSVMVRYGQVQCLLRYGQVWSGVVRYDPM